MEGSPYSKTHANMQAANIAGVMPRLGRLRIARPMPRIDKSIRWARFLFAIHPIQMNHAHSNTDCFLIAMPIVDLPMSRQYQHSGLNAQGHQCHLNAKKWGRAFRPYPISSILSLLLACECFCYRLCANLFRTIPLVFIGE
jgi:hypothetical protein